MAKQKLSRHEEAMADFVKFRLKDVEEIHSQCRPTGSKVLLIDFKVSETVSPSGIIIPNNQDRGLPIGIVVGLGGKVTEETNIGDVVFYKSYEPTTIVIDGKAFVLCEEHDIKLHINPNGLIHTFTKSDADYLQSIKWAKHQEKLDKQAKRDAVCKQRMDDIANAGDMGIKLTDYKK